MEINESYCEESFYGPKRDELSVVIPVTVIYVIIFITGVVGNVTTCLVIARNKSLHTATNYYLFSLAVSDLVLLVAGLPQEIYLIWYRYPYIFGNTFCFLRGLLAETSGNATVLTITGFTVERYLAICHPFLSHTMSKLSRAVKFILFIWTVAVSFAIPQALPLRVEGPCPHCLPTEPVMYRTFEISTFVFFVAPMTLIIVLYALIGAALKSSTMMKTKRAERVRSKSSRKVIKMLVAVAVAFFICWAPFHIQRLYTIYATFPKPDEETHSLYLTIYSIVTYVSGVLYYMSATTNPILYSIMSIKFREAFKETFTRCCGFTIHKGKPERRYSVLSRSNNRGPESSESANNELNTSLTRKSSNESFQSAKRKRFKFINRQQDSIKKHPSMTSLPVATGQQSSPTNKYRQFFICAPTLTTNNLKINNKATKKENCLPKLDSSFSRDISNSSLQDVEVGALEDELTAYMKELSSRNLAVR